MMTVPAEEIPQPGQWPVDPQEDEPVREDRIWVDGCFDFSHHGERTIYPRQKVTSVESTCG